MRRSKPTPLAACVGTDRKAQFRVNPLRPHEFCWLAFLSSSTPLIMSETEVNNEVSADTLRDRALEVVTNRGWLSKNAWSMSKALHAFAKPMRVVLTAEIPSDTMQQLLLRSPIVAVQLGGSVVVPP
eukprot:1506-Heterococcus_DN1.PRE.3